MAEAYAICNENKCKRPVYTKEEIDEIMPVIRYGTGDPDDSVGKDGDVYIKITE